MAIVVRSLVGACLVAVIAFGAGGGSVARADERPPTVANVKLPLAPLAYDAAACRRSEMGRPNGAAFANDDAHRLTGITPVLGQSVAAELFPNTPVLNFLVNHRILDTMDMSQFGARCFLTALHYTGGTLGYKNLADGDYVLRYVISTPYVGTAHTTQSQYETVETPYGPQGMMVDHDASYATNETDTRAFARPVRVRNDDPVAARRLQAAPLVGLQGNGSALRFVTGAVEPPRGKHPVDVPDGTPVNVHFYDGFRFGGVDAKDDAQNYRVIQVDDDVRVGDVVVIRRGSIGLAHDDFSSYGTLRYEHGRKGDGYTKYAFHLVNVFSVASTPLAFQPETIAFDFQQILDRGQVPATYHIAAPDRQFTGRLQHAVVYLP